MVHHNSPQTVNAALALARKIQSRLNEMPWSPEKYFQTMAATLYVFLAVIVTVTSWPILLFLAYATSWGKAAFLAYLAWLYIDWDTSETGGRRKNWVWGAKIWTHFRDYFPVKLVKTAELPPDQNYLLVGYPHGVFSLGVFAAFGTSALHFEAVFPGLRSYLCTVGMVFKLPFIRELLMASGCVSVSKKSVNWVLESPGKGRAVVIVAGGAEEGAHSAPGTYKIVLNKRKGFCKLALQNGSDLVPMFSFGETDVYDQLIPSKGSFLERFQLWIKKVFGVMPVIASGRRPPFTIVPRRSPITVVVGKPIKVKKLKNPSEKQIEDLHREFKTCLLSLFDDEKHKYLADPETELIIV